MGIVNAKGFCLRKRGSSISVNVLGYRFVLVATPSHVSIPPNQKGTLAEGGFSESGKCLRKLQACECSCVVACVFRRDARLSVSVCGRLGVTNAQAHLIGRWGVTV